MKYLQQNFLSVVILVVVSFMLYERCNNKPVPVVEKHFHSDTTINIYKDSGRSQPLVINVRPPRKDTLIIKDSTNLDSVKNQLIGLLIKHYSKVNTSDTLTLDTLGSSVVINDWIQANTVIERKFKSTLKQPVITNTITLIPSPTRQLYFGFGLQGNKANLVNQMNVGLMYKNRRDQLFGGSVGMDITGNVHYGIQSYWKIKF